MRHAEAVMRARLPELKAELSDEWWEWEIIGDNWLAAWNWACRLEREALVDHQEALRFVVDHFKLNSREPIVSNR